jgi:sterol desaturase/sphingolipid hydroxylase (fatty acid hydroxylase superfamily)
MLNDIVTFVYVGLRDWALYMGSAFVLIWFVFRPRIEHRKIQLKQRANTKQWIHEVKWTLASQVGFVVGLLFFGDGKSPGLFVQLDTTKLPILLGASLAFIVVDDAWFYWTHRFLHGNQRLYRTVHKVHHRSIDTNPLTSLSFHPIESFIINVPLAVLPIFIGVSSNFFFWAIWISTLNNIAGHNGFEWAPSWWNKIPLLRLKTPSIHHNLHHEKSRGNYGLYFTYWDTWMGTQFSDYDDRVSALRTRMSTRSTDAALGSA